MKRPFRDGTIAIVLPAHAFLRRLCALVPPPRVHQVRYHGQFAPHATGRRALTGQPTTKERRATPPDGPDATTPTDAVTAPSVVAVDTAAAAAPPAPTHASYDPYLADLGDPTPRAPRASPGRSCSGACFAPTC